MKINALQESAFQNNILHKNTVQNSTAPEITSQKNRWRISALVLITLTIAGCGGGGGGSSAAQPASTNTNNSSSVQGVATPSGLSVVTAQNANAGS